MKKPTKRQKRQILSLILVVLLALASRYLPDSTQQSVKNTAGKAETILHNSQPGRYRVNNFVDGDTIVVDMDGREQTVRFIGVDTPEEFDRRKPVQCFAKAAAQHTRGLIGDQPVRLVSDPLSDNKDRYDRLLRYVYSSTGTFVNYQLVADGYGFTIHAFPFTNMDKFKAAQKQARQENKGLWGKCSINYPDGYPQTNAVAPAPRY